MLTVVERSSSKVTTIEQRSKGDAAHEVLRREILSCRIAPGATISEPAVIEQFGVGRATCRVALQRLVAAGLVEAIPRQGYRVSPVTLRDVENLFEMRLLLEPHAARAAAGRADIAKLERLEHTCRAYRPNDIGNQIDFFLEANRSFHMAIAHAAGNNRIAASLSGLYDEMARLVALGFGNRGERPNIDGDHVELIRALKDGDGDGAERVARRHVEVFREQAMRKVLQALQESDDFETRNLMPLLGGSTKD